MEGVGERRPLHLGISVTLSLLYDTSSARIRPLEPASPCDRDIDRTFSVYFCNKEADYKYST